MDLGIKGRRALVLASSRGLGLGVATALVAEGVDVAITGRSAERLEAAAARLNASGPGRAVALPLDFAAPDAVEVLVRESLAKLGGVDILVNNTGGPPPGPVSKVADETWTAQFDMMVRKVISITGALVPAMIERRWGRVLTLASTSVIEPIPYLGISNTLRSALVGWSKSLASEIAPSGVTVNMLLPGRIQTERVDELDRANAAASGKTPEAVAEASRASIPLGRYGTVEEFADVAAFLVSQRASYVTGTIMRCDGGAVRSI
ncbi:3-oxoacyl-[acyl-carrier protein] reductase [Kaistia hirudinis]|uniref:3-oxoacyl-[acyl-carrier protein] reductase n=1 Tax=Kaistia hirudinis TaxID=1293440 RepID=A0A840AMF4_9HYPH|nr:SDR family oxidoreductase [Kaistia hirudinis]MBB3930217.1 3-oxoacyl-[acyl-carrier protein] reductase [Kaistia hirudinis]